MGENQDEAEDATAADDNSDDNNVDNNDNTNIFGTKKIWEKIFILIPYFVVHNLVYNFFMFVSLKKYLLKWIFIYQRLNKHP